MNLQKHRPQDQNHNKSKQTVKSRASGKTPTLRTHPSQRRIQQKGPQKAHFWNRRNSRRREPKRREKKRKEIYRGTLWRTQETSSNGFGLKSEKTEEKEEVTSLVSFLESEEQRKFQLLQWICSSIHLIESMFFIDETSTFLFQKLQKCYSDSKVSKVYFILFDGD